MPAEGRTIKRARPAPESSLVRSLELLTVREAIQGQVEALSAAAGLLDPNYRPLGDRQHKLALEQQRPVFLSEKG